MMGSDPASQRRMSVHGVAADIFKYGVMSHMRPIPAGPKSQADLDDIRTMVKAFGRGCLLASEVWHDIIDERILAAQADQESNGAGPSMAPRPTIET